MRFRCLEILWPIVAGLILPGPPLRLPAETAMQPARVGNQLISRLFTRAGEQTFTSSLAAKTHIAVSSEEFDLTLEADHSTIVISRKDCSLQSSRFSADGLRADFVWTSASPPVEIAVQYWTARDAPYIFKQIKVRNRGKLRLRVLRASVDVFGLAGNAEPIRGGVGQPVLLSNEWFFGIEHPAALNQVRGRTIDLSEFPDVDLAPGASWQSDREVMGATPREDESVEGAFRSYLLQVTNRRPEFRKVYCDWAAHDEMGTLAHPQLTYQLTRSLLGDLEKMQQQDRIHFDYYTIDAFWYDPRGAFLTFKKPNWPDGYEPALRQIRALGMKPGLWFDLGASTLDLAHTPGWNGPDKPCLSETSFERLLDKAIAFHIEHDSLSLIEFDFANLNCAHDPNAPPLAVIKRNADALRGVIENARRLNPDLFIRAYNTFSLTTMMNSTNYYDEAYPVSPWWLFWFDSIYCGDPRPADLPSVTSLRDSVDVYQDHVYRGFARSLLPLSTIDDSGTLVGKTSTIYYLGAEGFTDSWILNIMRGNLMPTFFGDLSLLTAADRTFLSAILSFANRYQKVLDQTKPILGVPGRGQVYGYLASTPQLSFVTVVNPGLFPQSFHIETGLQSNGNHSKLIYTNDARPPALVSPDNGELSGELTGGEIRVYAIGGRSEIFNISLPYAPTRRFHTLQSLGDPFHGKTVSTIRIGKNGTDSTLAIVLRYWHGGIPDRSSHTPQNVVKVVGSANGQPFAFKSIPRRGTDIWSGCSWAVFEHVVTALEAGDAVTLTLVGKPQGETRITIQALWLK